MGESQKQSTLNFLKDERFSPPWSGGKKCIGNLGINILGGGNQSLVYREVSYV